ncbi:MAG TPA: MBL fold metallo-hydrolase [Gaiellaceae bacterium]|nr:MBL fold metallo-hydrolase [Gaiellaceae bacterium]
MRAAIWGCRGSLSTPGERTVKYGGNTSCVEVRSASGRLVILDAGTGIRPLGDTLADGPEQIDLVLTHLHLDHVEGLGFFAPLFDEARSITIWGPHQAGSSLAARIGAYLSPPFFPVDFAKLPARIEFVECGEETWQLDSVTITSARVAHPGDTLAYRLEENGRTFAFIPDNELGADADSGLELAEGADVLFHDAQYTQEEYSSRAGWGHSSIEDLAVFLRAASPARAVMFHHDPWHSDGQVDAMHDVVEELAGRVLDVGAEGAVYDV